MAARSLVHQPPAVDVDVDVDDTLAVVSRVSTLGHVPALLVRGNAEPFKEVHYGQRLDDDLGVPLKRIQGGQH